MQFGIVELWLRRIRWKKISGWSRHYSSKCRNKTIQESRFGWISWIVVVEEVGQCVMIRFSLEFLRSSTQSNKTGKLVTLYGGDKLIGKKVARSNRHERDGKQSKLIDETKNNHCEILGCSHVHANHQASFACVPIA